MFKFLAASAAIITSALLLSNQSFAAGGGDDNVSTTPICKKGYVYSRTRKKCVRKTSEVFPDSDLKKQGWKLAHSGKYEAAIVLFDLVANKSDAEALNGLGYSHRKQGKLQQGFAFYKKALSINPDYLLAREYLGEGYVAAGRIDLAKNQLQQIKIRCGTTCKEYSLLANVIATGGTITW